MSDPRAKSRAQLLLIALVFIGPLAIAAWLYFQGQGLAPEGRTNHGALLEPIVDVSAEIAPARDGDMGQPQWILLFTSTTTCEDSCREALYTMRQSRLMLGKEMDRVQRVFLHGESPLDTVFLAAEHPGLITIEDGGLNSLLENKRPTGVPAGGYFLIDPLGNLVMYFRPDLDPADMVDDIKHLLRLSRIG